MTLPLNLTALQLSHKIHQREISCVDVMQTYLQRIATLNPQVNALVNFQPAEKLLQQAQACDAELAAGQTRGWMHGFPIAPKDITSVAGVPTTMGSRALAQNVPKENSIIIERMLAAGGIIVGRSNVPEFGLGSHTYNSLHGTTQNAWRVGRSAGGSSGGAAVAVALNMLPVADGSDVMGSLRNPAAWNNIYGLRPSLGVVPASHVGDVFFQQLGTDGPMARNVPDLAQLLATLAGRDARIPLSLSQNPAHFTQNLQRDFKGAKIGWLGDFDGYLPMENGLLEAHSQALKHFETLGCVVEAVPAEFDMAQLWQSWLTLRGYFVSGHLAALYAHPASRATFKPEAMWEVEQGLKLTIPHMHQANLVRSAWYQYLQKLFAEYDYLVLPSTQVYAFDSALDWPKTVAGRTMDTYHRWMEVVIGATLAGVPALSVPAGFSSENTPFGLQILAPAQADFSLLQIGYAWQQATPFGTMQPALLK